MPPGHELISENLRGIFPYDLLVMEASSNPQNDTGHGHCHC